MKSFITICIFFAVVTEYGEAAADFDYEQQGANWGTEFPICARKRQSPIDITTAYVETNYSLGLFDRNAFYTPPTSMTLKNNGHALQMDITGGAPTISDRKLLPFDAQLAQYHIHWGVDKDADGSEHLIDGKRQYGEFHMVHFNQKYSSLTESANKSDGLAVLAFLISSDYPQDNEMFDQIFDLLDLVQFKDNTTVPTAMFSVETLLPPKMDMYYRYEGSLTTPTCDESVLWTVFADTIEISPAQAEKLSSSLYSGYDDSTSKISGNFRVVQDLNGRTITAPGALVQKSSAQQAQPPPIVSLTAILLAFVL